MNVLLKIALFILVKKKRRLDRIIIISLKNKNMHQLKKRKGEVIDVFMLLFFKNNFTTNGLQPCDITPTSNKLTNLCAYSSS